LKLMVGNSVLSELLSRKLPDGSLVLFKHGPGSGGDLILKQFFIDPADDRFSVYLTTHETREDVSRVLEENHTPQKMEVLSLLDHIEEGLEKVKRKDRFRTEGLMVTDLLEITTNSNAKRRGLHASQAVLSELTSATTKQVLPMRLVLDSVADLFGLCPVKDVIERMRIIKRSLREKGGIAVMGAPLGWDGLSGLENTLFDSVIEVRAEKKGESWTRTLTIRNIKGSPFPPEEWPISYTKEIPTALSMD